MLIHELNLKHLLGHQLSQASFSEKFLAGLNHVLGTLDLLKVWVSGTESPWSEMRRDMSQICYSSGYY